MIVACFAAGLYVLGFTVHLIVWRIRRPKRQSAVILVIMFGVLLAALAATQTVQAIASLGPWGFWQCSQIALFHVAMTLAYVVGYSALEARSPSMTLLSYVADSKNEGRSREELGVILRSAVTVEGRMTAMVRDNMVEDREGQTRLTRKGWAWAMVLSSWRKLAGLNKGG